MVVGRFWVAAAETSADAASSSMKSGLPSAVSATRREVADVAPRTSPSDNPVLGLSASSESAE